MRLGAYIQGFRTPEEWAQMHIDREYGAAYLPTDTLTYKSDDAMIQGYIDAAKQRNLVIAEVGAWRNLLDHDNAVRQENLAYVVGQLKLADRARAKCCVNIAGSLNPSRWDGAHPDNLTDHAFGQTVEMIQQVIDSAQPKHTFYTVEPMPWLFPLDIASMHRMIKAVNRSAFGVHVDMCNMINSFEKVYKTGEFTRNFFGEFGSLIKSVHFKDTVLENTLTLHIHEAIPGQGIFDHEALLMECDKLDADLPVMAEHLETPAQYEQATDFFKKKAKELELSFVKGN